MEQRVPLLGSLSAPPPPKQALQISLQLHQLPTGWYILRAFVTTNSCFLPPFLFIYLSAPRRVTSLVTTRVCSSVCFCSYSAKQGKTHQSDVCVFRQPLLVWPLTWEGGFTLWKAPGENLGSVKGPSADQQRVQAHSGSLVGLSTTGCGYAHMKISFQLKEGDYYFRDDSCSGNNPNLWSQQRVLRVCWVRPAC